MSLKKLLLIIGLCLLPNLAWAADVDSKGLYKRVLEDMRKSNTETPLKRVASQLSAHMNSNNPSSPPVISENELEKLLYNNDKFSDIAGNLCGHNTRNNYFDCYKEIQKLFEMEKSLAQMESNEQWRAKAKEIWFNGTLSDSEFDIMVDLNIIDVIYFGNQANIMTSLFDFSDDDDNNQKTDEDETRDDVCADEPAFDEEEKNKKCGNGILESPLGEQCDDGNKNNGDGCNDKCQLERNRDNDNYIDDNDNQNQNDNNDNGNQNINENNNIDPSENVCVDPEAVFFDSKNLRHNQNSNSENNANTDNNSINNNDNDDNNNDGTNNRQASNQTALKPSIQSLDLSGAGNNYLGGSYLNLPKRDDCADDEIDMFGLYCAKTYCDEDKVFCTTIEMIPGRPAREVKESCIKCLVDYSDKNLQEAYDQKEYLTPRQNSTVHFDIRDFWLPKLKPYINISKKPGVISNRTTTEKNKSLAAEIRSFQIGAIPQGSSNYVDPTGSPDKLMDNRQMLNSLINPDCRSLLTRQVEGTDRQQMWEKCKTGLEQSQSPLIQDQEKINQLTRDLLEGHNMETKSNRWKDLAIEFKSFANIAASINQQFRQLPSSELIEERIKDCNSK